MMLSMDTVETNSSVSGITKPTKKKKVGFYVLGSILCETPTCQVREAVHTIANAKVMVKVYPKSVVKADEELRERLRRKSLVSQKLNHPNIVQLYEILETGRNYYVVEEICEGGHLLQYLQSRERLEEMEARRYMRQLISAVDHMHQTGYFHRDLRLDNLVLDRRGNLKISEVWSCTELDKKADFPCCIFYCAPEVLNDRPQSEAVDIWSLGVILFAILNKSLPFIPETSDCREEMKRKVLKDYHISESLSPAVRHLISRLLEPTAQKRISMEELLHNPWLILGYPDPIPRFPPKEKMQGIKPQKEIIHYIEAHTKFDKGYVNSSIAENKKNSAAAMYFLILSSRLDETYAASQDGQVNRTTKKTNDDSRQLVHSLPEPDKTSQSRTKCSQQSNSKSKYTETVNDSRLSALDKRMRSSVDESRMRFPHIKESNHSPYRKKGKSHGDLRTSAFAFGKDEVKLSLPDLSVICLPIQRSIQLTSTNNSQNSETVLPMVPPNTAFYPKRSSSSNDKGKMLMSELCDKYCDRYSVTIPASQTMNYIRYSNINSIAHPLLLNPRGHQAQGRYYIFVTGSVA